MKRTNTVADALNTNIAQVDPGDGLPVIPIPLDGKMPGYPGPAGPGVPEGGTSGQYIEKTGSGTTQWATPTKAKVGLSNVDNTSDESKPISSATQEALNSKTSQIEFDFALETKADLVGGKVPASQIPSDALVTDENVAFTVGQPLTSSAIDDRIVAQVEPTVNQLVADAIADDQTIVDAAAAAVDASPAVAGILSKNTEQDDRLNLIEPFAPSSVPDDEDYAHVVLDTAGKFIEGELWDGTKRIEHLSAGTVDSPAGLIQEDSFEGYAHVTTDAAGKLLMGEREDGTIHIPHLEVDTFNGGASGVAKKIVIVAGQSNAIWRFNTDGPELTESEPRLKWWNRISQTESDVSPNVTPSIASAFSRKYLEENPNVEILIVPVTVGSTGFRTSSINPPPEGYLYTSGGTWDRNLTADPNNLALRLFDSLAGALDHTGNAEVLAMLWSQGENDRTRMDETTYGEALDDFLGEVRTQTGQPDMPVVIGSMTPEEIATPQAAGTEGILRALEGTQARLFNTSYVWGPANHLQHTEQIHWSPEGNRERGIRMATDGLRRARLNLAGGLPYSPRNPAAKRVGDQVTISWDYPLGRATQFVLDTSPDGVTWATIAIDGPLVTSHTVTSADVVHARISSINETGTSYPTMEVSA